MKYNKSISGTPFPLLLPLSALSIVLLLSFLSLLFLYIQTPTHIPTSLHPSLSFSLLLIHSLLYPPLLLFSYRKYQAEEDTGASVEVDCGQEWPEYENTDVTRYREFYQVGGSVLDKLSNTPVFIFILLPPAFHLNIIATAVL